MNLNDFSLEELDYILNCMKRVDGWNKAREQNNHPSVKHDQIVEKLEYIRYKLTMQEYYEIGRHLAADNI